MKNLLNALSWEQGLSTLIAAGAVVVGLAFFSHWSQERDFRPLYSALSAEDAASVLARVKESGSEFRLSDNGTAVLVPSARVAELRLQMARAGVPKSGRMGYELFDKTNVGGSDFAEQVNYQRALEVPSEAVLDYRKKIERDLLSKINSTLEPLLGLDKFRATASVECDFTSGEQSDETYDPTKTVMVTSQKTEDMSGSAGASAPGTSSNLLRPTLHPSAGLNGVSRRTEDNAYQSSHTVRHSRLPQGNLKRMSVSLLLDSNVRMEGADPGAKRIVEPPSAGTLKAIHDLVAGVIGFSAERGDQLIVETLPFEATLNPELASTVAKPAPSPPVPWYAQALKNKYVVIGVGLVVAVMLTLLGVVVRLLRRPPLAVAQSQDLNNKLENQLAQQATLRLKQEVDALNAPKLPAITKRVDVLTKHIREQAKQDSSSMAQVLRSWMTEPKN